VAIAAASSHGVLATVFGHLLEATGDRHVAALLAMTRCQGSWQLQSLRFCILKTRDDEI
jgi:hypothetical protein